MIGKVVIAGVIVVVGAFLFLPQTIDLFPDPPEMFDSVKNDISEIQDDAVDTVEDSFDKSYETVSETFDNVKQSSENFLTTQTNPDKIIPTQTEEIFFGKIKEDAKTTPTISRISRGGGGSQGGVSPNIVPTVVTTPETQTISFETLSLVTEKTTDDNVMIKYEDTSGDTNSVTVTMRNEEKILFTGQFFSSSFEATVLDAADTPHFIDMIVDHKVHGTISASAFNPAGTTDTSINGVFTSG